MEDPNKLAQISILIEKWKVDAIRSISKRRDGVSFNGHFRRMTDMYLSQPSIMQDVEEAKQRPAASE